MATGRIPVIIDADPGCDDVIAILLALASPELDILAFVISYGNTDIEASYLNIFKIYQAIGLQIDKFPGDKDRFANFFASKPIVARGPNGPLSGDKHMAQYFHGRDGLGDITTRHPELNVTEFNPTGHPQLQYTEKSGVEVVLDLIRSHPSRSITYIALGPLTNVAQAMRADGPTIRDRIGRIVCMGGALDVPGNTSPAAEFNFFADPWAVKELLIKDDLAHWNGLPLERFILLPLDITTPHELPFPHYKKHVDPSFESPASPSVSSSKSPVTHFTSSFLERTREIMLGFGNDAMELHDITAVWCAIENPPVAEEIENGAPLLKAGWKATRRIFDVERTGEITRGMLVVDRRLDKSAYAPGANRAKVQEAIQGRLEAGALESTAVPAEVELESAPRELKSNGNGVACIVATPGPDALLSLLLERVWGIST